jgi:hypothetical protein
MSQKILNNEVWFNEFVNVLWSSDRKRGEKLARRLQARVQHAMDVLDKTSIGQEVVFEGCCPSGSTYEGYFTWDGSAEMREKIAEKAYRLGGFDASAAWLVQAKSVRQGIFAADLRTGNH